MMHEHRLLALRDDLEDADYRTDTVRACLGADADSARARGVLAPARFALAARPLSPLVVLIRFFLLGETVRPDELDAALPRFGAHAALDAGLAKRTDAPSNSDEKLRAALSLNPVVIADAARADPLHWWLLSDLDDHLRAGPVGRDHVMGVGGATRTLIGQLPAGEVEQALDLGTGCGVVALHLALRGPVIATDLSPRALDFARMNARLNSIDSIEFREGNLWEPVTDDRFDLIASNPPFVISPHRPGPEQYGYRETGLEGDELMQRVLEAAADHLAPGGRFVGLGNWEYPWGADGLERVDSWIRRNSGAVDRWIIERDRVSPIEYATTWTRDGGMRPGDPGFEQLVEEWLTDFETRRITGVGMGVVHLRASERDGAIRADRIGESYVDEPVGAALDQLFTNAGRCASRSDSSLLDACWQVHESVVEIREHRPGAADPRRIDIECRTVFHRRVSADTIVAAAIGACDGDLTLRQISDALAELLELEPEAVAEALLSAFRELVWIGVVRPVD